MPNAARELIRRYSNANTGSLVAMNEVTFVARPSSTTYYLGTDQLSVCTVIAIASPTAAIMAHIAPMAPELPSHDQTRNTPLDPGNENLAAKLGEFQRLYEEHNMQFNPGQTIGAAGLMNGGGLASPDVVRAINTWAIGIGLPKINWRSYGPVFDRGPSGESTAMAIFWQEQEQQPSVLLDSDIVLCATYVQPSSNDPYSTAWEVIGSLGR